MKKLHYFQDTNTSICEVATVIILKIQATFQTPEAIITRSKRLYCYLQQGLCANGGEPINGECGCNPVEADGRFCENVRCHNGGPRLLIQYFKSDTHSATNINNVCHCAQGYTGTNCQYSMIVLATYYFYHHL